jgi:alkyl sulfatase BDS1-like metallo-beta-lactamase superfamily hydrolase
VGIASYNCDLSPLAHRTFGGVLGVVEAGTQVSIVAPQGFQEHALSEKVYAGTAMLRRGSHEAGRRCLAHRAT